jgi:hypothetical protein
MNNHTILTGKIKLDEHIFAFVEHCPECKYTRCVMQSDLCTETVEFKTSYYPGKDIFSSLKEDLRELIPVFDAMVAGKAPEKPFMVSTVISE